MTGKWRLFYQSSYDLLRTILMLMISSKVKEFDLVGDTKTFYCVLFYSFPFNSIKIELWDCTDKKIPSVSVEFNRVVLFFRKISIKTFWVKTHAKYLLKAQLVFPFLCTCKSKWYQFWCSCSISWKNSDPFHSYYGLLKELEQIFLNFSSRDWESCYWT